jgi:hypothetical protein
MLLMQKKSDRSGSETRSDNKTKRSRSSRVKRGDPRIDKKISALTVLIDEELTTATLNNLSYEILINLNSILKQIICKTQSFADIRQMQKEGGKKGAARASAKRFAKSR